MKKELKILDLDLEHKVGCYYQDDLSMQQLFIDCKTCNYEGKCDYKDNIGMINLCYKYTTEDYKK